jgi:hypothetical protein
MNFQTAAKFSRNSWVSNSWEKAKGKVCICINVNLELPTKVHFSEKRISNTKIIENMEHDGLQWDDKLLLYTLVKIWY